MTVREYLDFFAATYQIELSRRQPLIKDLLELLDLNNRQDDFVHLLPRPQAQRLALARALLHDPPLLLLDEPTVGLDFTDYRNLRELLVELTKMGKTIFFTASAQDDLTPICTHLALLNQGRLLLAGSVADLQSGAYQNIKTLRLRLRPLLGLQSFQVQSLLFAGPGVQQVRQVLDTGEWQVQLAATSDATATFMRYLIRQNLPVYSFTEHALSLEELFQQALSGQPVAS